MVQELHSIDTGKRQPPLCRSCGGSRLILVLSLGTTPLANALLDDCQLSEPEATWPLELVRCEACSLAQITETVPPETLFSDYAYFSSFSDTMVAHAKTIALRLIADRSLDESCLVAEVASNDGYLLQWYRDAGIPVLGIEPAENIAMVARDEKGIPTLNDFFGQEVAKRLASQGQQADIIHANNVLAHVADLNGVVSGFQAMLKPDGRVVVECPYLKELIENVEFDTIYHEHLCYFSLTALDRLFRQQGLEIIDVEHLSIHGGSLRIFAAHAGCATVCDSVRVTLDDEAAWVHDAAYFQRFADRVQLLRTKLVNQLCELKAAGNRIVVYGASAKGSTLLNYFGIDGSLIDYVVDRSTVKQGRHTPGTHLKIYSPDRLTEDQPQYCLLLTWNFADEILRQQHCYRENGGKFIIPIPDVRVA